MMVDVSRRSFLGGALALTAASALPLKAFASAPVIYGDGVHDDTAGLQAALDGKPFRVAGHGAYVVRENGRIHIGRGDYRLSDTLHLRGPVPATLSNFRMKWDSLPPSAPCLLITGSCAHVLRDGYIEGPKTPWAGWGIRDDRWVLDTAHAHTGIRVEA